MKNYIAEGEVIPVVTPSGGYTSGTMYLVGDIPGVAVITTVEGAIGSISIEGVYELPKASGAIAIGKLCYWDDSAKNITGTASSNKTAGYCYEAAASAATTVKVALMR